MTKRGRCLCGKVSFDYQGPELWCAHCHCESCRRNCSAPFTTFIGVRRGQAQFTGSAPASYASSPGVERLFCRDCGSPLAYRSDRFPDEIHFYAASLDDPASVTPQCHVYWSEKLPWITCDDGLPRYERSAVAGG
jgi:hypothetical protein